MSLPITDLRVTPIAFRDPPLLNSWGMHEPLALRAVVELEVDGAVVGLGEGWGALAVLQRLEAVRAAVIGLDVFATDALGRAVDAALGADLRPIDRRVVVSPLEVAALDAQGRILGVPVSTLLGGAVRDRVEFAGYLFYKHAGHPDAADDDWGAALDPAGIVAQAERMRERFGFGSFKLKGGVFPPDREIAAIRALAEAFPEHPLRLDPNGAWTVPTALRVAEQLRDELQYLEDPVLGMAAMAEVARGAGLPLATNMVVEGPEDVAEAVRTDAVQVILADHHTWGGLRRTRELGAICAAFGIGMSMHSNSHLGISLAAMAHVAAATPLLDYASDTHYPWNGDDDIVAPGALEFVGGSLVVPTGPGLGVELDADRLEELHRAYVDSGRTVRDDTAYLRRIDPSYDPTLPRF